MKPVPHASVVGGLRPWRRALAALFVLAALLTSVAVPAAPATSQEVQEWSSESTEIVTRPDGDRVPYEETVTLYVRANDEVIYRLCESSESDNCDEQTVTCRTVSGVLERINEQADAARSLLIAQGVRDIVTTDRDSNGNPIDRDDVRLRHLLEKLLPILPLRYRFLNPDVDPPDAPDAANPVGDPDSYRHPDVTDALEVAAVAAGLLDAEGDGDIDAYVESIVTPADVQALPRVIRDLLTDEAGKLTDADVPDDEKAVLLAAIREALRVDPEDWPVHAHSTLALLDRYLDRGLADVPPTSHSSGVIGRKFFLLEDIPYDIVLMAHQRGGSDFYLWPWSRADWTGGFLSGLLEFLGVRQPDLAPIREAKVSKRLGTGDATRPAERVVVEMMRGCRPWHISNDLGVRQVGSSPVDVTVNRGFGPLRPHDGPPINRTVVVNRNSKVLLQDSSGGDTWWEFPDSYYGSVPGFFGPDTGSTSEFYRLAHRFWLRLDVPGSAEDRYVHASYLSLRYDDRGTATTSDDEWQVRVEGEADPAGTFPAYPAGDPYLQEATPWRSAAEPHGVTQSGFLGEWVPGGVIELSGEGLGEVSLEYCLSRDVTGRSDSLCARDWEQVTVMVEPDGWDDARAWANDDAFRLFVNWENKQVVLLAESDSGAWEIDGVRYDILERLCCLTDEASDWSLDLALPVMNNDTVRFFRGGRLLDRWGNQISAASIGPSDQAACPGSRYCTFLRPKPTGGVDAGGFGLAIDPYFTSLELEVSAPAGDFTGTSETRHFGYCLAHRDENCGTSPATCAVATYVEPPRAPNAPHAPALTTGDLPSHHFVATDLCVGADAEVTLTINVYGTANPPDVPEEIWEESAAEPPDVTTGPRKCFDDANKTWKDDWFLDPADDAWRDPPSAWCDVPQRVPADLPDDVGTCGQLAARWQRVWHRYATTTPKNWQTDAYWQGDTHDEAEWWEYWDRNWDSCWLPEWRDYLTQDWLEGCQRTRPTDTWLGRDDIGDGALLVGSEWTRWQNAPYRGRWTSEGGTLWFWEFSGASLITVGRPLIEADREVCERAKPRIIAVWGTHVGAPNWITGPGGGPCTDAHDSSCADTHGAAMSHDGDAQHLGDGWHQRLADVEPCIGEAECDVWVPPIPGWYQVRIEVVTPSVPMRVLAGSVEQNDTPVTREICEDVVKPDPDDPDETITVQECETADVMWNNPDAFIYDDLIWVEGFRVSAW